MSDTEEIIEYDAILVDTSIFDRNALKLESGLLSKLNQFKKSHIKFIFPDVIKSEVQNHLEKKIKVSRNALEKSINDAGDHLFFDGSALNNAKKLLIDSEEVENLAISRLSSFIENTGALIIESSKYVSVEKLLEQYFSNKAPFAETGKKKNEFPDAIILLAVEKWAEENNFSVLAIADDKDWKNYCDSSDNINYQNDFAEGLATFNKTNIPYTFIPNLESAMQNNQLNKFIHSIEIQLESVLEGLTPYQEADSSFLVEGDGIYISFKKLLLPDNKFRMVEVDIDEGWIVLEVLASITIEAEGDFSFSIRDSIDKDYVSLGSNSVTVEVEFKSEILITIVGDLEGDINELDIESVEVIDPIETIYFGTIDPDYGEYD